MSFYLRRTDPNPSSIREFKSTTMHKDATCITILLVSLTISLTCASLLDEFQKEKGHLRSSLAFLEKLESREPDENSSLFQTKPLNCLEILGQGWNKSGIYTIYPRYKKAPLKVFCDMETDGGGWIVFQRRDDYKTQENFFRSWKDYRKGFGSLEKDFWIGNTNLYTLTHQDTMNMRVDMEDFEGNKRYAQYDKFQVSDDNNNYKLLINGYSGDASDNLSYMNNMAFVTYNRNDVNGCSKSFKGGWWYTKCHAANLNGLYLRGNHSSFADGVNWKDWMGYHYSLKKVEMKMRPRDEFDDY